MLTIVTRLTKANLAKANTGIINKNFKNFDMQHKSSESFVHGWIFVLNSLTETLSLTAVGRIFQSKLPQNCTKFILQRDDRVGGKMQISPFLKL